MNWALVILGIILVILVYTLYKYFTSSSTLQLSANLNNSIPAITDISSPTSSNYSYSLWVYVNSWKSGTQKVLFSRNNNLKLYLDATSPTLYLDVTMQDNSTRTTLITTNFPIQRWVFVAVSAENQYFDIYMDGKLTVSQRMYNGGTNGGPAQPPDKGTPLYLGNAGSNLPGWDATATNFNRYTNALDPQTVWTTYMSGNGMSSWNPLSGLNVNLNVLQNGLQSSQISLL